MRVWVCVLLGLALGSALGCAGDETGEVGVPGFSVATAVDLGQKAFRFGPGAGLFPPDDPRHGQSATLIVGEFGSDAPTAGFALTSDDGSLQGGVLSLGSCDFTTMFRQLAGEEPQIEPFLSQDFFEWCGIDSDGRLGLVEDDEGLPVISEPPTEPTVDLDETILLAPRLVVDPPFPLDGRAERGTVELGLVGNVLSYSLTIDHLSATDEFLNGQVRGGGALENGDVVFTLFGEPIQLVRSLGPPFLEGSTLTASLFLTPDEAAALTDAAVPLYINFTSQQISSGLMRGQLRNLPVGPEGGVLAYPNAVVLEIPPGALSESVAIEVTDYPTDDVNEMLSVRDDAFLDKRVLGGFRIEPHIVFNVPITGIVPVLPPGSYELMWRMEVDFEEGRWWPVETELNYLASLGVAEIEIPHTSSAAVAGGTSSSTMPPAVRRALDELLCKLSTTPDCEALDPLQPGCCLLYDFLRPEDCGCCREGDQRQQSNATDFAQSRSTGVCEFLNDRVISQYYECQKENGEIVDPETSVVSEVSPNCPPDMKIEVAIAPKTLRLRVCESHTFTATVRGVLPDGTEVIPPQSFDPLWRSSDLAKADFFPNQDGDFDGTLTAIGVGDFSVDANPGLPGYPLGIRAQVTVESNVTSLTADPPALQLSAGQTRSVDAIVELYDGSAADEGNLSWYDPDPHVATAAPGTGLTATITARGRGCTEIKASYEHDCETVDLLVPVCVECSPLEMTVTPAAVELLRGESKPLSVEVLDESGAPVDASSVRWVSGNSSVADVTEDSGPTTSVLAVDAGQTEVTALLDDGCQLKRASATVEVGCVELELSLIQGIVEVDASLPITVSGTDSNGQPVQLRESDLTWRSEDLGTAAPIPSRGSATVGVKGVEAGSTLITASYDDGSCPPATVGARIVVTEEDGIGGVWDLTPTTYDEKCRYLGQEWWEYDEPVRFSVRVSDSSGSDNIIATYVPHVGAILNGTWDDDSGEFDLSTNTSDPSQCDYLLYGSDICGEAVNCEFVSCHNTTDVTGQTDEDVETMEAHSDWYYSATFSFGPSDEPPKFNTWECMGSSDAVGSRR